MCWAGVRETKRTELVNDLYHSFTVLYRYVSRSSIVTFKHLTLTKIIGKECVKKSSSLDYKI